MKGLKFPFLPDTSQCAGDLQAIPDYFGRWLRFSAFNFYDILPFWVE